MCASHSQRSSVPAFPEPSMWPHVYVSRVGRIHPQELLQQEVLWWHSATRGVQPPQSGLRTGTAVGQLPTEYPSRQVILSIPRVILVLWMAPLHVLLLLFHSLPVPYIQRPQ